MSRLSESRAAEVTVNGSSVGSFDITVGQTMRYETIRTDLPTISPSWRYTDKNGHAHHGDDLRATLREVRVDCGCSAVDEPHDVHDHWECIQCGETIEPGTYIPGPISIPSDSSTTITLTGASVSRLLSKVDIGQPVELVAHWAERGATMNARAMVDSYEISDYSASVTMLKAGEVTLDSPHIMRSAHRVD